MAGLFLPNFNADFLDEKGKVSRVWLQYLQVLFARSGEWDGALLEGELPASSAALIELAKAVQFDAADGSAVYELQKQVEDLTQQLATSSQAVSELHKRLNDLDSLLAVLPDPSAALAEARKLMLTNANKLSDLAPTTSAEFATVITDETGYGKVVFSTSPTLINPELGDATGKTLALAGKFGCNGSAPQNAYVVGGAATDLATVVALANKLRTLSINIGIAA